MADRWNPPRRTLPTYHAPIFVVPGESTGSSSVTPMGKTWGMRVRGDVDKRAPQTYRCSAGHEFVALMPLSLVADEVPCATFGGPADCTRSAAWAGSSCGIGHAAGEVMS